MICVSKQQWNRQWKLFIDYSQIDILCYGDAKVIEDYFNRKKILFSVDTNDKNLRVIIEDSGIGFTPEELHSATKQFFQGDKSRNSKNHYGMGLYIVRKFVSCIMGIFI